METVVQAIDIIAASGIENSKPFLQAGGANNSSNFVSISGFSKFLNLNTFEGPEQEGILLQFQGVVQHSNIIKFDPLLLSSENKLIVFSPNLIRSQFFSAVIGTLETIERDFDRSPFFFSPHETDPNTVRDLFEAQQFLVFTNTTIRSFKSINALPHVGHLLTVKGSDIDETSFSAVNAINNGSFELGSISRWQTNESSLPSASVQVLENSVGTGVNPGLLPNDGIFWTHLRKNNSDLETLYLKQEIFSPQILNSSVIKTFSWEAVFDSTSSSKQNSLSLVFFKDELPLFHLRYRFGSQNVPASPSGFPQVIPISVSLPITIGEINNFTRQFTLDSQKVDFNFNKIQIWWLTNSTNSTDTNTIIDNFNLNLAVAPEHFLPTSSFSHLITTHPTASGFPFTISGAENITQLDETGPRFDNQIPEPSSRFNSTAGFVAFTVKDDNSPLDQGNVDVWIDDLQVVNAGSTITGTVWTSALKQIISNSEILYEFTRFQDFLPQSLVTVSGELVDLADPISNETITEYQFLVQGVESLSATVSGGEDATGPEIIPISPVAFDSQVSPNTKIVWRVTDNASGVDPNTLKLLLNGAVRLEDDLAVNGSFNRNANDFNGFDYIFTPDTPFNFGQTVTGTLSVSDFAGNPSSLEYQFVVTPDDTLKITNFFLEQGQSTLITSGTNISVCVEDFVHSIDLNNTDLLINGTTPSGLITIISGFTPEELSMSNPSLTSVQFSGPAQEEVSLSRFVEGPNKVTFLVPTLPLVDFRTDLEVAVQAQNKFPGDFPVITQQNYVLNPGYDVNWWNRNSNFSPQEIFDLITNVQVLAEVKNFAKTFNSSNLFYRFLTEGQSKSDLGASITSNIKTADLGASTNSLNTIFEYGKEIVLEIEVADLEGNLLNFIHTFTIEPKPDI